MGAAIPILLVFVGCCSNVIFLELLVKDEPACGTILTFAQFLFIAVEGFVVTMDWGRKKNAIPVKEYLLLMAMFFTVNVTNNMAFGYKISMPLHIIFRSGGLIASLVMGVLVLGRSYALSKYLSVIMITLGTIICTFASAENLEESNNAADSTFTTWLMGIGILTFALFMSARMGIFQEMLYVRHGKHPREALFFIHTLSLPGFLLTWGSIAEHVTKFSSSAPLPALAHVPGLAAVPRLWLYLVGNVLTQYLCVSSVFKLGSEATSLTVTLVLTLRKFMSLVFSIIYFQNPFTINHWIGTFLVFAGTLIFTDVLGKAREAMATEPRKKTE
ncbi:UDP-xylose and UDP-N-acetylglucosamine transporter-like [Penaeus japonicus]|uniref:UDP-xylose and UDP-N-acetylglucosamine transporter-like n=1 Tax=Penaeus japonicus TaxID=27405 RepID=UPI001C714BDF|nr:UDP-xylose and UDP-N-acetylglucosamine transporter-like [Penaeus japonicus]XP_042878768.1 UDP-xylose and UDP-N-acetylglucosamine transporter-like [Penaeus japonicus]